MAAFFRLSYSSYAAIAVLLAVIPSCFAVPKVLEYDYESCGLDWKGNCSEGKNQSPINIVTRTTMGKAFPTRNFRLQYESISPVSLHHTGHVIEVQVKSRNNIMHTPSGPFQLRQFHFHAISEHSIDGFFGPLEVHFVHFDASGAKAAVFAVLFALSPDDTDNPLLNWIFSNLPRNTAVTFNFTMGLKELLLPRGEDNSYLSYYTYTGSLTTPPCAEIVTWYVRKRVSYISMKQLAAVVMVNQALGGDRFDNRLPVPLNCRKVASHRVV